MITTWIKNMARAKRRANRTSTLQGGWSDRISALSGVRYANTVSTFDPAIITPVPPITVKEFPASLAKMAAYTIGIARNLDRHCINAVLSTNKPTVLNTRRGITTEQVYGPRLNERPLIAAISTDDNADVLAAVVLVPHGTDEDVTHILEQALAYGANTVAFLSSTWKPGIPDDNEPFEQTDQNLLAAVNVATNEQFISQLGDHVLLAARCGKPITKSNTFWLLPVPENDPYKQAIATARPAPAPHGDLKRLTTSLTHMSESFIVLTARNHVALNLDANNPRPQE